MNSSLFQSNTMYPKFHHKVTSYLLLWYIRIFHVLLSSIVTPGEAVLREHTIHESAFDFTAWKESSEGFDCPPNNQKYKLLCEYRWNIILQELNDWKTGAQCANGSVVISSCIIAIEAIAIGALMFFACRMRKKTKEFYQECKREGGDVPETIT